MKRLLVIVGTAVLALGAVANSAAASAGAGPGARGWVGTWESAPASDTADTFGNTSIREVIHVSVGGSAVRVRLSNRFGTGALALGHVTVALRAGTGADAVPGTLRPLTFAGRRSTSVPAGADVRSDPVPLGVPARSDLLVSLYLPSQSGPVTYHALAEQTSYTAPAGDHTGDGTGSAYTGMVSSWFYLSSVDVLNSRAARSFVAFGDSITDGYQSTYGTNHRWPDLLAARALATGHPLGALNAGISGNRLLLPGDPAAFGPPALDRLGPDALTQTGVSTIVVLLGINDIQQDPHQTDPTKIEAALRAIAVRAHQRGIRVVGGTLTPFEGWSVYDATLESVRIAVNRYIRTSPLFDGVVDFDRLVRDPADPHRMLPAYDSGDHLHPNDAGYQVMADGVNLRLL